MKTFCIFIGEIKFSNLFFSSQYNEKLYVHLLAFAVVGALADGVHNHGRQGRARPVNGRRQQPRRGREEELSAYGNGQVRSLRIRTS